MSCRGTPRAVSWGPDRLDVFSVSQSLKGDLFHRAWSGKDGKPIGDWKYIGGTSRSSIVAPISRGPDRIDLFFRGDNDAVWHKFWNGSSWQPSLEAWENLGGRASSDVTATYTSDNRIEVFMRGPSNALYCREWNGSSWQPPNGWRNLLFDGQPDAIEGQPYTISWNGTTHIELFIKDTNKQLFHRTWDPAAGWLSDWKKIGNFTLVGDPTPIFSSPKRLDLFLHDTDVGIVHRWFDGKAWHRLEESWVNEIRLVP